VAIRGRRRRRLFVFQPQAAIGLSTKPPISLKGTGKETDHETRCDEYIDGACALTDVQGDIVFSTFDTRDLDTSQPKMDCGTHTITGGTGKYAGITGREPFACITQPTPAGAPAGSFAIDIPHNTSWVINK
jgi:hypothetical protein